MDGYWQLLGGYEQGNLEQALMPYGNDEWLVKAAAKRYEMNLEDARSRVRCLKDDLKSKFNVPDEFMDLAVRIWWDGKED